MIIRPFNRFMLLGVLWLAPAIGQAQYLDLEKEAQRAFMRD